ncbi:MAG: STAS/SEC14 domain-containing protein [Dinghuibacter sp.]|nr:STAS/SEC14 domain-containing protein [Dinghuibacter sp.]
MSTLQTDFVSISLKNGVLYVRYLVKKIDRKIAMQVVQLRKEFTNNTPYPILADARNVVSTTRDAREYISSAESIEGVLAGAILTDTSFNAFIANFFVKVTRPKLPTRVFSREEDALKWLEQYKK